MVTARASLDAFRTVLVPTDFSAGASAALERALALPLAAGARIEVLHVVAGHLAAKARAKVEAAAADALAKAAARAREAARDVDVTSELVRGDGYVEIIRRARELDAELVVLGRHGVRPLRDLFLGSTASRIVRMADTPVLVVRGDAVKPYRRPLVATDLEDTARRTLELALRIVGARATIRLVHAFHVPFEGFQAPTAGARRALRQLYRDKALARLEALVAPYQDRARWNTIVHAGDARSVVLAEAVRARADVIAIGTHGRSGLAHALIGSVAEFVIANAACDVLVARPVRFSFELP